MMRDDSDGLSEDLSAEDSFTNLTAQATNAVLRDVLAERVRQDEKWGWFRDFPDGGNKVGDDAAERIARQECERAARTGRITWRHIIEEEMAETWNARTDEERETELIQTAACLVAQVEAIRRRRDGRRLAVVAPLPWWKRLLRRLTSR